MFESSTVMYSQRHFKSVFNYPLDRKANFRQKRHSIIELFPSENSTKVFRRAFPEDARVPFFSMKKSFEWSVCDRREKAHLSTRAKVEEAQAVK
jgi:hypothetical protein